MALSLSAALQTSPFHAPTSYMADWLREAVAALRGRQSCSMMVPPADDDEFCCYLFYFIIVDLFCCC
jgi:hypothetical protein